MDSESSGDHKTFYWTVGIVKILRLVVTLMSMTFFIIDQAPEPYVVITGFEFTVILFFIALYILRLDKVMKCLFWPLLDIINSMVTTLFMIVVSVLALIPETTTMTILGGVFGLLTVTCATIDCAVMYRKLRFNPS